MRRALAPMWESVMAPQPNRILSSLSGDDLELLQPHLEPVDLPLRKVLEQANKPIKAVYFPESGFASVVVNTGKPIEVGLIGREGMTGLAVVFGVRQAVPLMKP